MQTLSVAAGNSGAYSVTASARIAEDFAAMAIDTLNGLRRNPDEAAAHRQAQIAYVQKNYTWPQRALEWQSWLFELILQQS